MRESDVQAMLRVLRKIQEERYLSLKGLARLLGFSSGHLSMIYSGRRRPGIRFLRAAMERFPEMRQLIAKRLRLSDGEGNEGEQDA